MNTTHCLCYNSNLTTTAYNLSFSSLQCIADQVTQSAKTNRTIWNIAWSSLTTIFACTWVSCHPNIDFDNDILIKVKQNQKQKEREQEEQEQKEQEWEQEQEQEHEEWKEREEEILVVEKVFQRGLKRWWSKFQNLPTKIKVILVTSIKCCWPSYRAGTRIGILLVALIAPEFIVLWALRQYMAARVIVKSCKGWTMTHAFFSLMGGFVIADKEQDPICALVLKPGEPRDSPTRWQMMSAFLADDIKACFRTSVSATTSVEAFTLTSVDAAERLADTLVMEILETMVGCGSLPVIFKYRRSYLRFEALEMIEAVSKRMGREIGVDLPWDLQRKLWNRKEEIRAILLDRVPNKLWDTQRDIRKTFVLCPKEEIEDKSKRDWLAKIFALAQTTWFVVQCIARKVQHLPLTEIELMTCAYATLSAAIYAFWWHKPFGVQFPLIIRTEIPHKERETHSTVKLNLWDITTLAKFLAGSGYDDIDFRRQLGVPTFYSGYFKYVRSDFWNFIAEVATAAVFGGIHLLAWNYEFPTQFELWLWRVSTLVIVGLPPIAVMPISILTRRVSRHLSRRIYEPMPTRSQLLVSKISLPVLVLLYIIARLSILVLALISLRRLPVGTLTDVDWLTFIPHID